MKEIVLIKVPLYKLRRDNMGVLELIMMYMDVGFSSRCWSENVLEGIPASLSLSSMSGLGW